MGLGSGILWDLIELKRRGFINGATRVAEIGEQQLADTFLTADEQLDKVYRLFAKRRIALGGPVGRENFTHRAPPSRAFWQSLGVDYLAIDLVGDDVLRLDLNRDAVPTPLIRSCDLVVNGGTTEHIANQDNAFRVIHDLTKPGGIMIHGVPCQGLIMHGLVNYSPKFFYLLCRANDYEALSLELSIGESSPMPPEAIEFTRYYGEPAPLPAQDQIAFRNCRIHAVLRKRNEAPFVTPIDAPQTS